MPSRDEGQTSALCVPRHQYIPLTVTFCVPAAVRRCLKRAMSVAPRPLGPEELKALTWEAATERFLDMADQHKP